MQTLCFGRTDELVVTVGVTAGLAFAASAACCELLSRVAPALPELAPLAAGELVSGSMYQIVYDGTNFQLIGAGGVTAGKSIAFSIIFGL